MSKERIEIGTVVEVADAKQSINELRQSIEDSKTSLKSLNSGTEDYNNEIKGLVSAQKDLIGLQESLIGKFEDTSSITSNLNSNLSVATNTVNGMMGGFQALQGVMVLAGKENKNLVNTLVKLQAVSSVVQGFKQFTDAVKAGNMAFKIFNTTVRANPLMFLATSIISVITLFNQMSNSAIDAGDEVEEFSKRDVKVKLEAHKAIKENTDLTDANTEAKIKNKKERDAIRDATAENIQISEEENEQLKKQIEKEDIYYKKYGKRIDEAETKTKKEVALLKAKGATNSEILAAEKRGYEEVSKIKNEYLSDLKVEEKQLKERKEQIAKETNSTIQKLTKDVKNSGKLWWAAAFAGKETQQFISEIKDANDVIVGEGRKTRDTLILDSAVVSEQIKENTSEVAKETKDAIERDITETRLANELEAEIIAENHKKKIDSENELERVKKDHSNNEELRLSSENELTNRLALSRANTLKDYYNEVSSQLDTITTNKEKIIEDITWIEDTLEKGVYEDGSLVTIEEEIKLYKALSTNIKSLTEIEGVRFNLMVEQEALDRSRIEAERSNKEQMFLIEENYYRSIQALQEDSGDYVDINGKIKRLEQEKELEDTKLKEALARATDESLSWELKAEAIQNYEQVLSDSYAIEAELTDARIALKEREKQAVNATLEVTADALMGASELAKEGTVVQKTLAIAGTTISTLASAQNVYESTAKIPFVGKVLAPIAAATALMQGYKRVKEIAKVKVPNGKKGGSSGMPQPQILQSMPNVQQTVTKMDGDDLDIINKDSKVYVVESDITNQQRRVKVAENEASF